MIVFTDTYNLAHSSGSYLLAISDVVVKSVLAMMDSLGISVGRGGGEERIQDGGGW